MKEKNIFEIKFKDSDVNIKLQQQKIDEMEKLVRQKSQDGDYQQILKKIKIIENQTNKISDL